MFCLHARAMGYGIDILLIVDFLTQYKLYNTVLSSTKFNVGFSVGSTTWGCLDRQVRAENTSFRPASVGRMELSYSS